MGSYQCSDGTRVTQVELNRLIFEAKSIKREEFLEQYGYFFCEDCKKNKRPLDMSHNVSVQQCKMQGRTELAWDVENIKLRCRDCHNEYDNSGTQFANDQGHE